MTSKGLKIGIHYMMWKFDNEKYPNICVLRSCDATAEAAGTSWHYSKQMQVKEPGSLTANQQKVQVLYAA